MNFQVLVSFVHQGQEDLKVLSFCKSLAMGEMQKVKVGFMPYSKRVISLILYYIFWTFCLKESLRTLAHTCVVCVSVSKCYECGTLSQRLKVRKYLTKIHAIFEGFCIHDYSFISFRWPLHSHMFADERHEFLIAYGVSSHEIYPQRDSTWTLPLEKMEFWWLGRCLLLHKYVFSIWWCLFVTWREWFL